jgi:hypothetical protein
MRVSRQGLKFEISNVRTFEPVIRPRSKCRTQIDLASGTSPEDAAFLRINLWKYALIIRDATTCSHHGHFSPLYFVHVNLPSQFRDLAGQWFVHNLIAVRHAISSSATDSATIRGLDLVRVLEDHTQSGSTGRT